MVRATHLLIDSMHQLQLRLNLLAPFGLQSTTILIEHRPLVEDLRDPLTEGSCSLVLSNSHHGNWLVAYCLLKEWQLEADKHTLLDEEISPNTRRNVYISSRFHGCTTANENKKSAVIIFMLLTSLSMIH